MAIIDNRLLLDNWETNQPDDLSGAAGGTADTEIFIEGLQSYGYSTTNTRGGLLFDAGSAQDWSGSTFYIWVNCGIAGLLDTFANGGMAVRFAGATVTDFFETNIAGADIYPTAVAGGWVMLVVDIEKAKLASHRTGGTPPATTAIRYVGISTITNGVMPRMVDNTWLDAMWRLPAATPGVLVEGRNTGPVDWTWADLLIWSETNAAGIARPDAGGAVALNTPIRFGANDAVEHGFDSSNELVLWQDWDVDPNFYGIEVVGGSGIQRWRMGVKSGTGDDATGAQGGAIVAGTAGQRWFFDADDANVDLCELLGVNLLHGGDFQLDGANVSAISSLFVDCSSAVVTGCADFLRNSIIDANTADGVAFLSTSDITDVVFCGFEFSDGHAIELLAGGAATQASKGNSFTGYGADGTNDAALYNNSAAAKTINVTDGGDGPTVRNGASASTTVNNAVTLTVTALVGAVPVEGARVRIQETNGTLVTQGTTNSSGVFTDTFNFQSELDVQVVVRLKGFLPQQIPDKIRASGLSTTAPMVADPAVNLP